MPKLTCTDADVEDPSFSLSKQLLEVQLTHLPQDAEQLQTLLEAGMVPATQVGSCFSVCSGVGFAESISLHPGCLGKDCLCVYCIRLLTAGFAVQVTFQYLFQKYSEILIAGEGLLAQHFSCCIAGGFMNAVKAIVETWHYIRRFARRDRRLTYSRTKNQGLGSVERSTCDPSRVSLCALALPSHKGIPSSLTSDAALANERRCL